MMGKSYPNDDARRSCVACLAFLTLLTCAGCPQYRDWRVPGEIRQMVEPRTDGDYYLYVPTTYDRQRTWALGDRLPWDPRLRRARATD